MAQPHEQPDLELWTQNGQTTIHKLGSNSATYKAVKNTSNWQYTMNT